MNLWAGFYEKLFNFREIRYFSIEGKETGLFSRALDLALRQDPHPHQREPGRQEPDRGVSQRIPRRRHPAHRLGYRGHLPTVDALRARGIEFQDTPDTYYEGVDSPRCRARET